MCDCKQIPTHAKVELTQPVLITGQGHDQWLPQGLRGIVTGSMGNKGSIVRLNSFVRDFVIRNCYLKVLSG